MDEIVFEFEAAFHWVKKNYKTKAYRKSWNNKFMSLSTDENMAPYLLLIDDGIPWPYTPSAEDMWAEDWILK